jgi:hypothetical protein
MKKFYFYVMIVVCLICTVQVHAQTRYWVRAANSLGNWNDAGNWSATSGGGGGASVPNASSFDVVFDQGALVNVDIASFSLNTITVSNATPATLVANAATDITLVSTSAINQALRINTGARLEDSCNANVPFSITFGNGANGLVAGTWYFSGVNSVAGANGSTFTVPGVTGQGNRVDVNGTVIFKDFTRPPSFGSVAGLEYIYFNSGSLIWYDRNGGSVTHANWASDATLRFTGITTTAPFINVGSVSPEIGNLIIDCPNISLAELNLALPTTFIIKGNFQVLNTNGNDVLLSLGLGNPNITVQGNVDISGNSFVYQGNNSGTRDYSLTVNGNFNLSAGSFLMQKSNIVDGTTTVSVKGNFNHTGGTFSCASTATSTTEELFVLELSGTSNQDVTSSTGTIDNANNMVTLRMNNAAGATLLTPLSVGKVSWNTANKGKLTTTAANYLTINNPSTTDALVVNNPGTNGFVSGPVRRLTNSTNAYTFPVGKGTVLRQVEVIPNAATASTFTAEHFNTAYSDLSVAYPLLRVSNTEYWNINRIGAGSDASVRLFLNGAITGANAPDTLMVAKYNGTDWARTAPNGGGYLVPGNSTTGSITSALITAFTTGLFTIGVGNADVPLPVILVTFDAKKLTGNAARVNWTITSNSTPERFEVLRSADGNNFSTIGTVNGADQQLAYDFTDNNLPVGVSYYRLRMFDIDGTAKLSRIVAVTNGVKGILITSMMPTLVVNKARINVSSSERNTIQLVVTDMQGRIVKQQQAGIVAGNQEIWLNLSALSSGAYQVTGYVDGQRTSTIRFIKQ